MSPHNFKDLTNKKFGRLLVLCRAENKISKNGKSQYAQWLCKCDCGNQKVCTSGYLNTAKEKSSCGCYWNEIRHSTHNKYKPHGMSNTRLYRIFRAMKNRCYNKKHIHYDRYGGRGINICNEWMNKNGFINFYKWAIKNGYDKTLTIDRINNNDNYYPENCRWATTKEQQNNMRSNIILEKNKNKKTLSEWCEIFNVNHSTALTRLSQGKSFDEIFVQPRIWESQKQSGIKGVIYNKKQDVWIVKGLKNNKLDTYIKSFKNLNDAIEFKEEYDKMTKITNK